MERSQSEVLEKLRQIDEYEFERLVADVWDKKGWKTETTVGSRDRGVDVKAIKEDPFKQKVLIQAKRYKKGVKVGSPEIREYSSLRQQEDDVDIVVIVTTSTFTPEAQKTASDLNLKMVDGKSLYDMLVDIDDGDLLNKYVESVESEGAVSKLYDSNRSITENSPNLSQIQRVKNTIRGTVIDMKTPRTVTVKERKSKLLELKIWSEDKGIARVTLWNEWANIANCLEVGNDIVITDPRESEYKGRLEVSTTNQSFVIIEANIISSVINDSALEFNHDVSPEVKDIYQSIVLVGKLDSNNPIKFVNGMDPNNEIGLLSEKPDEVGKIIQEKVIERKKNEQFCLVCEILVIDGQIDETMNQLNKWEFEKAKENISQIESSIENIEQEISRNNIPNLTSELEVLYQRKNNLTDELRTKMDHYDEFGSKRAYEDHLQTEFEENSEMGYLEYLGKK